MALKKKTDIGFNRLVRNDWLRETLRLVAAGIPENDIEQQLKEAIATENSGKGVLRRSVIGDVSTFYDADGTTHSGLVSSTKEYPDGINKWHSREKDVYHDNFELQLDTYVLDDDGNVNTVMTFEYDENGNLTQANLYGGSGADSTWFTEDDEVYSYEAYIYDENGNRTQYTFYAGPGVDGVWFTDDDEVYHSIEYEIGL